VASGIPEILGRRLLRRTAIAAYRTAGLAMDNPLAANLALLNSDLMAVAAETVAPVMDLLQRTRHDGATLTDCERWANLHLRFVKQIDRLAAISQKLEQPPN
jgi:hypothetical protein